MRFYLDENLSTTIAEIARSLGLDVLASHETGRDGLNDEQQLELAASLGRCLVTANRDDFMRLTDQFMREERPHAGVLIVPRSMRTDQFARIARALRSYAAWRGTTSNAYLFDFLR